MKIKLTGILLFTFCLNSFSQDIAYGKHKAIYIGIFYNGKLKAEDFNTQNNKIDIGLALNVSYANIFLNNFDGQKSYSLEGASTLKEESSGGNTIYSLYYEGNKKLSFSPYKRNSSLWFTTVIYWPDKSIQGNYFKFEFPEKLIY